MFLSYFFLSRFIPFWFAYGIRIQPQPYCYLSNAIDMCNGGCSMLILLPRMFPNSHFRGGINASEYMFLENTCVCVCEWSNICCKFERICGLSNENSVRFVGSDMYWFEDIKHFEQSQAIAFLSLVSLRRYSSCISSNPSLFIYICSKFPF